MALIDKTCILAAGATLTLTYDDVALKLRAVSANNSTTRTIRFNITSPITFSRVVLPGATLSYTIPPGNRPIFRIEQIDKIDGLINWFAGIDWYVTLGN